MRRIGNAKTSEAEEKLGTVLQGNGGAQHSKVMAKQSMDAYCCGEARNSEASYCEGRAMYRRALAEHGSAMKSTAMERRGKHSQAQPRKGKELHRRRNGRAYQCDYI